MSSHADELPNLEPVIHTPRESQLHAHSESPMPRSRLAHTSRILTAPAIVFGCSFGLALQFALLTPLVMTLGVSRQGGSVVWLVGPVTGLVVQPIVGYVSDLYHGRHATRLPIVYGAAGLFILSHLGIAFSRQLGSVASVSPLVIVIVSFWLFDACLNAIIVTTRAMLSDRFCKDDRTVAFSVLQFWTSIGYLLGFLTAAAPGMPSNEHAINNTFGSNVTRCFLISSGVVAAGTLLSILSVREKRACRMKVHTVHTGEKLSFNTACFLTILAGSVLTWFGWFSQQIFQTDFVASTVSASHGIASKEALELSSYGLVISSALSCITGLVVIPLLIAITGSDTTSLFRIWSLSSLLQAIELLVSPFVKSPAGAVLWEAAAGPMYAVALSVPFMLVANGCDHGSSGRIMALINIAVCLPQLLVALGGGILVAIAGSDLAVFVAGGLLCLVAAYLLWVPEGAEVPPWSIKSASTSLIASTSDWLSPPEEGRMRQALLPPLDLPAEVRLRGLSTPRMTSPRMIDSQIGVSLFSRDHNV